RARDGAAINRTGNPDLVFFGEFEMKYRSKWSGSVLSKSIAMVLLAGGVVHATPVVAQDIAFDLHAAELGSVLPELGRQSGLQIVAPSDGVANIRTRPIKGTMSPREALAQLLEGTGIAIASDDGHTIALRAALPATASLRNVPMRAVSVPAATTAFAQSAQATAPSTPPPAPEQPARVSNLTKVEVVGTQIKRAAAPEALLPLLGL